MLNLAIVYECDSLTPAQRGGLTRWLRPRFTKLAKLAGATAGEATLALVDDARMGGLHLQYKGVPGPTDVLAFDLRDPPRKSTDPVAVDLVLCVDEARRQATARGHDWRLELLLYALHGLLHVRGHDDLTPAQARLMHRREDAILREAGFGAVYDHGTLPR